MFSFSPRATVLKAAITTLATAATAVAANAPSAYFNSFIAHSIDIPNTIQDLIARYALCIYPYPLLYHKEITTKQIRQQTQRYNA